MARPRLLLTASLATAGALALAACGDTADGSAAGERSRDCAADPGTTVTVEIPEFAFEPDPVTVEVCDSIEWVNTHTQPHTATGEDSGAWNTGNIAPGETSKPVRFDESGTRTYICALHPFMTGTVEVS